MTSTSTLTDRYVDATLRRLPSRQRPDIEKELRASIADAIDDRLAAGGDPGEAEHAVITELGDPARLAAGYADRPLHLVGPELYLDYLRLLTTLLATIVPIVATVVAVIGTLQDKTALSVIGETLGAAITTALHIAFWTTLLFAIIERTPAARRPPTLAWSPANLPQQPSRRMRFGELVSGTVAFVLTTTLVLLSPVVSTEADADADPIGVLAPWLWETGFVYVFIALTLGSLGVSFAKYYASWNLPRALGGLLFDLAPPIALIWLAANHRVLNPAFVAAVEWSPNVAGWIDTGLIVVAAWTIIYTIFEAAARARRG